MAIKLIGTTSGVEVDSDANKNLMVASGIPAHPAAGGWYTVTGGPTGIVAAALAADTSLIAMRLSTGSTRKAYITFFEFNMSPATLGAAAGVAGVIGLQRITGGVGSTGTERVSCRMNEGAGTATDITSIQEKVSALTMTSVVFGAEIAWTRVPLFVASAGSYTWQFSPQNRLGHPLVLNAGDGICFRTRVALAATQTWVFTWRCDWFEK